MKKLTILNSQERKLIRDTISELHEKLSDKKTISHQDLLEIIVNMCKKER